MAPYLKSKTVLWVVGSALALLIVLCASLFYYYFFAEHTVLEVRDARTGLKFAAVCKYNDFSYYTYIIVRSPQGRVISKNEIPPSADTLSACMNEPYYRITTLQVNSNYTELYAGIVNQERVTEVPLMLKGIDLPIKP
jgi:hypothetical protein